MRAEATSPLAHHPWAHAHPLIWPGLSTLAAAAAVSYMLWLTRPAAEPVVTPERVPERSAVAFVRAYQNGDFEAAAQLASGQLRRSLLSRARSARLRDRARRAVAARPTQLVIEESFLLPDDRLRFTGVLAHADTPDATGWPIALTVVRQGSGYAIQSLAWPRGAPAEER
jgi:hypothetical protein